MRQYFFLFIQQIFLPFAHFIYYIMQLCCIRIARNVFDASSKCSNFMFGFIRLQSILQRTQNTTHPRLYVLALSWKLFLRSCCWRRGVWKGRTHEMWNKCARTHGKPAIARARAVNSMLKAEEKARAQRSSSLECCARMPFATFHLPQ